jgi:hypothetical protein
MVVPSKKKNVFAGSANKIVINEDGEVEGHTMFVSVKEIDPTKFVKLYLNDIRVLYDLSKTAIKILSYFMNATKPNKDEVLFIMEECKEFTGLKTDASIYTGLGELIESNIIARTKHSYLYFINPHVFFNGDRVSFMKEYRIKKNGNKGPKQIEG